MVRAVVCDVSSLLDGGLAEQPVVVQTYLLGFHLDGTTSVLPREPNTP